MKNLFAWIIPQLFFAPDGSDGGSDNSKKKPDEEIEDENLNKENQDDENPETDLTDETDLKSLEVQSLYDIVEREDVDQDKILDWLRAGKKETLLFKDVKTKVEQEKLDKDKDKDLDDDNPDADKNNKADDDNSKKAVDKTSADKTKDDKTSEKLVVVDDKYILKQLEKLRDQLKDKDPETIKKQEEQMKLILEGINGDSLSPRALRNYVNGQLYIKEIKSPFDKDWKLDDDVKKSKEYIDKAEKQKNLMIVNAIKAKYPDFPEKALEDREILKEWERDFKDDDRKAFNEYTELFDTVEKNITNDYDQYFYIQENWEMMAKDTISQDVAMFMSRISKYNLELKDLGIDSLKLDDNLHNKYLWENVLFTQQGVTNPDIVKYLDNEIPIVTPGAVYNALLNLNLDIIIQAKEQRARESAYKSGIDDQPDPSLSDSKHSGEREEIEFNDDVLNDDEAPIEKIDQFLNKIKSSIAGKGGKQRKIK